mgnify:CR=1 FL=1
MAQSPGSGYFFSKTGSSPLKDRLFRSAPLIKNFTLTRRNDIEVLVMLCVGSSAKHIESFTQI